MFAGKVVRGEPAMDRRTWCAEPPHPRGVILKNRARIWLRNINSIHARRVFYLSDDESDLPDRA